MHCGGLGSFGSAELGVIYLSTHRQNTIDIVSMEPGPNSGFTQCVARDPFTEKLIGPSSGAWGRIPGQPGPPWATCGVACLSPILANRIRRVRALTLGG
jgi:hypothetical protein